MAKPGQFHVKCNYMLKLKVTKFHLPTPNVFWFKKVQNRFKHLFDMYFSCPSCHPRQLSSTSFGTSVNVGL